MSLLKLSDDVLLEIYIKYLNVKDVINLEKLCRRLRMSTNSRTLWLKFLRELDIDHAPDLPSNANIDALDTQAIRRLVVRAIRGFYNWNKPQGPFYHYEGIIPENLLNASPDAGRVKEVKLVSTPNGGHYLVAYRGSGVFQLWNVPLKTLVARYHPRDPYSFQTLPHKDQDYKFAVSVSEDGKTVRLFVCANFLHVEDHRKMEDANEDPYDTQVTVTEISLLTGKVEEQFMYISNHKDVTSLTIDGDFAAFVDETQGSKGISIFNWKTEQCVLIALDEPSHYAVWRIWLVHDHLVVLGVKNTSSSLTALYLMRFFRANVAYMELQWYRIPRHSIEEKGSYAQVSVVYTNWMCEAERRIHVRRLSACETIAYSCEYTIESPPGGKSKLIPKREVAEVDTKVVAQFLPSQMSTCGQIMVIPDSEEISHVADISLIWLRWTSSFSSLRSQEVYDEGSEGFDKRVLGTGEANRRDKPLQVPLITDLNTLDDFHMLLDPQSGAVHTRTTNVKGDICVYYI